MTYAIHVGDCREVLPNIAADSVHACVTDPPYGLGFMGKGWDHGVPGEDFWREVYRVLKPGAHLVAFGGTRTFHRLTCAIEDAGFEIRDCLGWLYGSGFPKSLDVSKAIDKERRRDYVAAAIELGLEVPGKNLHDWTKAEHSPGDKWWERFKAHLSPDQWQAIERRITGKGSAGLGGGRNGAAHEGGYRADYDLTAPATAAARQWAGWGTALKPAWEPIILARKPLTGTVAANVQEHGTGALNIDACRVQGAKGSGVWGSSNKECQDGRMFNASPDGEGFRSEAHDAGRWPANICHDGSEEVLAVFPETKSGELLPHHRKGGSSKIGTFEMRDRHGEPGSFGGDSGSAARFFFEAQFSDEDWLCRYLNLASGAGESFNLQSEQVASALRRALTEALPGGRRCGSMKAPSTNVTPNELRRIAEPLMRAILTIAPEFWRESQPAELSLSGSLAKVAVTREPTGTTTITASHWRSDGSAAAVTFSIIETSAEPGERASRFNYCAKASREDRDEGLSGFRELCGGAVTGRAAGSAGSAGAKASAYAGTTEARRTNVHPTVKPTDLMRWLCRLITPKGGTILDPFMGSGSTGKAADLEGFDFIGIELDPEYAEIAKARIAGTAPLFAQGSA